MRSLTRSNLDLEGLSKAISAMYNSSHWYVQNKSLTTLIQTAIAGGLGHRRAVGRERGWLNEFVPTKNTISNRVCKSEAGKTNEINERMLKPVIEKIKPEECKDLWGVMGVMKFWKKKSHLLLSFTFGLRPYSIECLSNVLSRIGARLSLPMNPFGQLARERLLLLIRPEGYWAKGTCHIM